MQPYLTTPGKVIYKTILAHLDHQNWSHDIDTFELSMLANSFDTYAMCAEIVKKEGHTQQTKTGFLATRPEVGIMQKCYAEILKHSAKFGLNPGDRKRIFKLAEKKRKKTKTFLLSEQEEKEAFISWWNDLEASLPLDEILGEPDMSYLPKYVAYCSANFQEPDTLLDLI